MGDRDSSAQGASGEIEKKIEEALRKIDQIQKTKSLVKTAEQLEALERRIVEATDKLAGALVAQKVQDSIKDKELKEDAALLVSTYPKGMKNQGPREATIRPSRGEPFEVETSYFSQKGKRKKRVGFYPELILLGMGVNHGCWRVRLPTTSDSFGSKSHSTNRLLSKLAVQA